MTGEFSLFEETLLVFEAWNLNILQYAKVLGAIQNAIQCHCAILWGKKTTTQTSLDHFFKRVDRIVSSKEPESVPSMSGMMQPAPHLLLTVLQIYHLPPLPPSVSTPSCLFTWCQPLYASCCTILLYSKMKNIFFTFF